MFIVFDYFAFVITFDTQELYWEFFSYIIYSEDLFGSPVGHSLSWFAFHYIILFLLIIYFLSFP